MSVTIDWNSWLLSNFNSAVSDSFAQGLFDRFGVIWVLFGNFCLKHFRLGSIATYRLCWIKDLFGQMCLWGALILFIKKRIEVGGCALIIKYLIMWLSRVSIFHSILMTYFTNYLQQWYFNIALQSNSVCKFTYVSHPVCLFLLSSFTSCFYLRHKIEYFYYSKRFVGVVSG